MVVAGDGRQLYRFIRRRVERLVLCGKIGRVATFATKRERRDNVVGLVELWVLGESRTETALLHPGAVHLPKKGCNAGLLACRGGGGGGGGSRCW